MKMMLNNVRLAFPALFKAQDYENDGNFRFKGIFIIDPEKQKALVKEIEANIKVVAKEKFGAKAEDALKRLSAKDMLCLHDGAEKAEKYEGFENMLYISAGGKTRPMLIDGNKVSLVEEDGKPYAGCFVNASIDLYAQKDGKRINASLRGVQFAGDGEAFGGGGTANVDEFDELEATDKGVSDLFGDGDDDIPF